MFCCFFKKKSIKEDETNTNVPFERDLALLKLSNLEAPFSYLIDSTGYRGYYFKIKNTETLEEKEIFDEDPYCFWSKVSSVVESLTKKSNCIR